MFDELFNEFGNDKGFQSIIQNILNKMILNVSNDVKFNNHDVDEELVKATLLVVINNKVGFEFLRSLNLALNGADEVAFGNVNEFLNKLELMYDDAETMREEHRSKTYGGL